MPKRITLANLAEATEQEVFDQVATHLLTQKVQSRASKTKVCAYRGANGLMCAAGCLISDDEYQESFDFIGTSWEQLIQHGRVKTDKHSDLIESLQIIHDSNTVSYNVVDQWEVELMKLAIEKGLNTSVLDNYKG
jgi:hypothetical protein